LQFLVMSFVLAGFTLFGRQFINLWVGKSYDDAYYICLLFFFPLLVPLIQNVGITILQARNQMRFRCVSYVIIAIVSFLCSLPLSQRYGALGCATATAAALLLGQGFVMNVYYQKRIRLDIAGFWKEITKMSIAPIAVSIAAYFIIQQCVIDSYLRLLIAIMLFSLIYIPVFWFASMNRYEKDLFGGMLPKIFKHRRNVGNK